MAVFVTVKVVSNHDQLCEAHDRIADYEESTVPALGFHVCTRTERGLLVSGTWQPREAFEELFARPEFQQILAEQNLSPPAIEIFEPYRSRH